MVRKGSAAIPAEKFPSRLLGNQEVAKTKPRDFLKTRYSYNKMSMFARKFGHLRAALLPAGVYLKKDRAH